MRKLLVGLFALAAACSSSDGDGGGATPNDSATAGDTVVAEDTSSSSDSSSPGDTLAADASDAGEMYGPYPAGPYGNKVGDVVPNLKWRGYVNATSDEVSTKLAFVDTSLDALRRTARKPYALIHVSDFI
jgi:hypothetical protein